MSMPEPNCDVKVERCPTHDDKLSIYCDEHEQFICGQCKLTDHADCEQYTYIPNLAEDICESEEISTVLSSINELQDEFYEAKLLAEAAKEKTLRQESLAYDRIKELRHDVIEVFDDFEKELREKIYRLRNRGITENSSLQDDNKRLLDEIAAKNAHLSDLIQSRRTEKLFRCMKLSKQTIKQVRHRLDDIKGNITFDFYKIDSTHLKQKLSETLRRSIILKVGKDSDTSLTKLDENACSIKFNTCCKSSLADITCDIITVHPKASIFNPLMEGSNVKTGEPDTRLARQQDNREATVESLQTTGNIDLESARYEETIGTRLDKARPVEVVRWTGSDTGNSCITGLQVLQSGHLVVVHHAHAKIRSFVHLQNQWKLEGLLELESRPWAATNLETNPQSIAITLPEENSFAILSIWNDIKVISKHNIGLECRGIAYNLVEQLFVLSVVGSNEFRVFDSSGRLIRFIQLTGKFVNPSFIVLSPDGTKMFVSDIHSRTISRVDVAEKSVESCYTGDSTCRPFGMQLVDSDLFVCDHGSHKLLRLKAYKEMKYRHRYSKELLTCHCAVAISLQSRRLFLSKDNFINVYSF